ncbi:MAG: enoyl-CoA hydratase/isomerase [Deltaproteobacteria bacterium]|nr:enoyl-CoA hydratase/isomerase [Deltaproteobacteria bacterium]
MNYKRIELSIKDSIATLTLNHPEVLNAISTRMLEELKDAVAQIGNPAKGIRCLVITGAGRGFCAGANLTDPARDAGASDDQRLGHSLDETYNPLFLQLRDLKMPLITAVNGPVAGIGMSLALMGDMVLAARSAFFLQAFRRIGLIPDGGATFILPRLIGLARAKELSILAERLPAEKALEWGLINRVYDDENLMKETMNLAEDLAAGPTISLSLMRQAFWQSPENTYEQQLHLESVFQTQAAQSEDAREGAEAFRQKRPPHFKGK